MQTSTASRNRGLGLSAALMAAATIIGVIRFAAGNYTTDGVFFLIMTLAVASVGVYWKVAGVHAAREQRNAEQQETGHTAVITPITAAGRHDAA